MTPERPSDPAPRRIALPTGPASITDVGEGPTVVAIHGLPGSARDFRWLGAALEPRLRLVRVEMPGFGGTPLETAPSPRVEDRADFVAAVIEALDLDRPVVLGHSMGGVVATALADRHPGRVRGLALLASVGPIPHRAMRAYPRRLVSALLRWPGVDRLLRSRIERGFVRAGFSRTTHAERIHALHCVGALSLRAHGERLARLRLPTLVAWTEDDPLVDRAVSEALSARAPAGPRIRFAEGGHNLQATRAVELAASLVAWCGRLRAHEGAATGRTGPVSARVADP